MQGTTRDEAGVAHKKRKTMEENGQNPPPAKPYNPTQTLALWVSVVTNEKAFAKCATLNGLDVETLKLGNLMRLFS